jgi:hypothetical protein
VVDDSDDSDADYHDVVNVDGLVGGEMRVTVMVVLIMLIMMAMMMLHTCAC